MSSDFFKGFFTDETLENHANLREHLELIGSQPFDRKRKEFKNIDASQLVPFIRMFGKSTSAVVNVTEVVSTFFDDFSKCNQ